MMMSNPHYFIAIKLPQRLKEQLSRWQESLKTAVSYKQWPHRDDLHITLKFLGDVDDEKIKELHQKLTELTLLKSFYTTVESIGTFGSKERPRVVWAGVHLTKSLSFLQKKVEESAAEIGFLNDSRTYSPHITLAKKWNGPANEEMLTNILQEIKEEVFSLFINEVVLYEIHPKRNPKYKVLYNYRLGE